MKVRCCISAVLTASPDAIRNVEDGSPVLIHDLWHSCGVGCIAGRGQNIVYFGPLNHWPRACSWRIILENDSSYGKIAGAG